MNSDGASSALDEQKTWLRMDHISKQFGTFQALHDINLHIRKGEFVCLLGPSGCGKTTLLRIIAGLEVQDSGSLFMGSREIGTLPPAQRNYGIVFQSYALFPNLTVAQNIGYALRQNRADKNHRVDELLDLVGLHGTENRYPSELSGGQQQRVALARALATSPSLLLLDEPLSALDAKVRERLRQELRRLQQKLGVTTIMVTHDQDEAMTIADTVVVMSNGQIEQIGSPEQIYRDPASHFVADFVGRANWLPLLRSADGLASLAGLPINVNLPSGAHNATLFCRPEDVKIETHWHSGTDSMMAIVDRVDFHGGLRRATLSLCADRAMSIFVDVGPNDAGYASLEPGRRVPVSLPQHKVRVFAASPSCAP
ncbi:MULTISPECIES: putative 2-aminoethylphosphonate ABC transporter ATP-binding protein [unclassified Undibacterium]|uniref:putative 2-aminoethylphosphonate ABC transporter ATP-binding protein n=1 Tax=unclassified Undibacterium TaxID=2630295 RepID=UPI002AC895E3|nr:MULTISPECIES: putative 2-aminoethylphosphonate ABC transporter ATP-binding protein [unclassified Undibacterium]MEB0139981.1 putative 2-aminoethylphosphonate ABC transporter ATP-binding protein [Undibacterium sp. CCC2.1]MEB0173001.1 putative 2-aminoethylphosphonate ABC transporter ATP-binding protein [Undibacterium sp. CCC1.1]MEB0176845.1 putative 2-aminoethylphosphonate ABC transporter ATP-binding protein [Undibacterium sp. CCC3.4]MEB0216077.1 putative 2-aminoethylphosphonate ABC transporter